ncbi:MAG: sigma-54-dependent Fis family transcriptional regulator [Bacteroidetes bacterium]|nr:sigma-54-dependent Fis family transcriptional regulator [Bacteroidota bacterium]MCH8524213.1 sigma-54 dependent transcriptional regulator [Balneolales bacterium]
MNGRVVLIDDDNLLISFMEEQLTLNGYSVKAFVSPVDAMDYLAENKTDLVVTDVKMNEMTGDEVLDKIMSDHPDIGVILITGFGNVNHSVNAMRKGAFDYITKPFTPQEFSYRIKRFFDNRSNGEQTQKQGHTSASTTSAPRKELREQTAYVSKSSGSEPNTVMVGETPTMKRLLSILPKIARNDAPVLIQSESGTGKEVYAKLLHLNSNRATGPYVKINCANLPTELVESTLFGHMKGSFTGAIADKKGAFDEADGGTLLLDEITEIDINVQAKLLRVLQEKEFQRVGSQKPTSVDVRIIATSNRNIAQAIGDGDFRADLYYRLNVFPITIPPLRERREDIPLLANYFCDNYTEQYNLPKKQISEELMQNLVQREWKGNVRELDNLIHRGVILSNEETEVGVDHVDNNMFSGVDHQMGREVLSDLPLMPIEEMELQLIKKALERTGGNQKEAAKILGISDRTIRNKLK